jgi:tRNA(Ile)-lysidine synthase
MAMLHAFVAERDAMQLELVVAHVHHGLRAEASDAEQALVEAYAQSHDLPIESIRLNMSEQLEQAGNMHAIARQARYLFFKQVVAKHHATAVVTAHHADDAAETSVLKLMRGIGMGAGLGMQTSRELDGLCVVRPLLRLNKQQLVTYAEKWDVPYLEDASNETDNYSRNYFRNRIAPLLSKLNPKWVVAINRYAEIAREEDAWMAAVTTDVFQQIVVRDEAGFRLKRHDFIGLPLALQRRLITLILSYLWLGQDRVSFEIVDDLCTFSLKQSKGTQQRQLAQDLHVYRQYDELLFTVGQSVSKSQGYCFVVEQFPTELALPNGQHMLLAVTDQWPEDGVGALYTGCLQIDKLALPLRVRSRRPGDRIALKGMAGRKSLKKWFIEQMIPSAKRDDWPIVCDANDVPVWVPGMDHAQFQVNHLVEAGNKLHIQYGPFIK